MNSKYIQFLVIATIIQTISVYADVKSLKSSLSEELDPVHESENSEELVKEQEKRTIFNSAIKNVAWVKHTALRPSGAKYVIGYGPVDLKLKPVLRPIAIKHQGYHYNHPKIHFHLKRPVIQISQFKPVVEAEWKPVVRPAVPIVKPVHIAAPVHVIKPVRPIHVEHVQAVGPAVHLDHLHLNPVSHIDHVHREPIVHVDHVHREPIVHVDHVHKEPLVHVDHVHPVHISDHVHHVTTGHINHLHHVTAPHIHAVQPGVVHTPFVPSAQLFEVTKPDLGVLPLGSVFHTNALKEIPAPQLIPQPIVPVHSAVHVHPFAPVAPAPVPIAPTPIAVAPSPIPVGPAPFPLVPSTPLAPVHHVHPIGTVHPAHLPVTHLHPVEHIHPLGHVHPVGHAHPVGHVQPVSHVHPVGHVQPVEHVNPLPYFHHDHIHPISHLHQDQVYPVGHPHPTDHIHGIGQPYPIEYGHHFPQNHLHLQPEHAHPAGHLHPVGPPQIGTQVDYHGAHLLHSLGPDQPPLQNLLPNHYHLQYPQIPQHQVPANEYPDGGTNVYPNQHYEPQEQPQFNRYPNQFQPEPNIQDHYPDVHEENRYEPANHVSNQHFVREGQFQISNQNDDQGYSYPQPQQHFIQPGQTDLQFPLHLPNHPAFNRDYEQDNRPEASQQHDNIFKPSIQLEPPFKK